MAARRYSRPRKYRKKRKAGEGGDAPQTDDTSKTFIEVNGVIEECLPATNFRIKLENGQEIIGHLSGRMRMNRIRLLPGDEVKVEMTPFDLTKGRITYRF
jgi:translation initiation factor IF-1